MNTTIRPDTRLKQKIRDEADVSYTDNDMNRDDRSKAVDALVGSCAEIAAINVLSSVARLSQPSSYKYDIDANGTKIEVKGRKTWDFSKPDLLVRTKFDLASDIYIQIDLSLTTGDELQLDLSNLGSVTVVGFVTRADVKKHGSQFNQHLSAKKNDTLLVPRNKLQDPEKLPEFL